MPWQQLVADVVMEIDPATGLLCYDELGLTVPRQSGKSTFVLAKSTHRCTASTFFGQRQRLVYTAQTRAKAREKWEEDFVADLEASKVFRSRVKVNRRGGTEHIRFANGSRFGIEANTEKAGHGGTLDETYIDEAFAQQDYRLEQAFGPAMITRVNTLLAWISTAGWSDASPYLWPKVQIGRAAAERDSGFGLAYFEWSAPEDCDPGDESVWWGCMPALGLTVPVENIRAEYEKARAADKMADFMRAYLNRWVPKPRTEVVAAPTSPIDVTSWDRLDITRSEDWDVTEPPPVSAFAIEMDLDHTFVVITSAGEVDTDRTFVEYVATIGRQAAAVRRCVELNRKHGPVGFVVDSGGPAAPLIPDLIEAGIDVVEAGTQDVIDAYADLLDGIEAETVLHGPQSVLRDAVEAARKRRIGDRGFTFDRSAVASIPIIAAALAKWGVDQGTEPSVFFLSDLDDEDEKATAEGGPDDDEWV